ARDLPPIDAVLLSHDHHADNLDDAGRAILPSVGTVVTTRAGARRLGGNSRGLLPWEEVRLEKAGYPAIVVRATPCRHGPPASRWVVGDVIGFALTWDGQRHGTFWITGDTVFYEGVREVSRRLKVGTMLLHMGGVRFPVTGPLRYTMTATDAVRTCELVRPHLAIPIHYEGWGHFQESQSTIESAFARASGEVRARLRWVPLGSAVGIPT
ncbi:MAG: MBL fold metallo-hydrolase, partial [Cytophagaceae bacterium]|nr:MBL fold metallo-hydrolase [Gemmatimonadaceae bacterium]